VVSRDQTGVFCDIAREIFASLRVVTSANQLPRLDVPLWFRCGGGVENGWVSNRRLYLADVCTCRYQVDCKRKHTFEGSMMGGLVNTRKTPLLVAELRGSATFRMPWFFGMRVDCTWNSQKDIIWSYCTVPCLLSPVVAVKHVVTSSALRWISRRCRHTETNSFLLVRGANWSHSIVVAEGARVETSIKIAQMGKLVSRQNTNAKDLAKANQTPQVYVAAAFWRHTSTSYRSYL
jgi:hypothetical protein